MGEVSGYSVTPPPSKIASVNAHVFHDVQDGLGQAPPQAMCYLIQGPRD